MDKCPFCGAFPEETYGMEPQFKCGTQRWVYNKSEYRYRSPRCYETELANLRSGVKELKRLVRKIINNLKEIPLLHNGDVIRGILADPEVRAIMENKI